MSDSAARPRWFTETKDGHSQWYVDRFRALAEEGADLLGEARFADTMAGRGSRILDAGCGAGRMAGALAEAGHTVVGLDADPVLIEAARADHPGPSYAVVDLSRMTLADVGGEPVDLTVCAGNVMVFVAPGTERTVLANLCAVTRVGGRVVVGFRRDDAYPFEAYDADLAALAADGVADVEQRYSTWHLDPFGTDSDFAVTVLRVR
jgi:2-polyprenyl-3-methyl-5-hydroxy-6-metoxy-1,4-benzoquinol methylase